MLTSLETMLLLALKRQDFVLIFCCWKTALNRSGSGLESEPEPKLFYSRNRNRKLNRNKSLRFHNTYFMFIVQSVQIVRVPAPKLNLFLLDFQRLINFVWQDTMVNTIGHRQTELSLMLGTLYTADQAGDRYSSSVADPYVFGPPGSESGSITQRYGSGSFYHQAKIV